MRRFFAAAFLAWATASAAPAVAQETIAPAGNAGVEQYLEAVPTAKGNKKANDKASSGAAKLPKSTSKELQSAGADGQKLLQAVESSAPEAAREKATSGGTRKSGREDGDKSSGAGASNSGSGGGAAGAPASATPKTAGAAPLAAVRDAVLGTSDTSGGMGKLLPGVLIATALGLACVALVRRLRTR